MAARWLLVRHGETAWTGARRYAGWSDIPLSDAGREQAVCLGARLSSLPLAAAYTSDLRRARETLELVVQGQGAPPRVHVCRELRELHFGDWEGETYDALATHPAAGAVLGGEGAAPGGESLADLAGRVRRWLQRLRRDAGGHPDATCLIVAHGGPLRLLLCLLLGLPATEHWRFQLDYASLSEVTWDAGAGVRIVRLNDRLHLDGSPTSTAGGVTSAPSPLACRAAAETGPGHQGGAREGLFQ